MNIGIKIVFELLIKFEKTRKEKNCDCAFVKLKKKNYLDNEKERNFKVNLKYKKRR